MNRGNRKAGYAIVPLEGVAEATILLLGTAAQKAALIALTRVLEFLHEKRVNVYTDSKCTFLILYAYGSIWKERGLLTSNKKTIKHAAEIFKV